MAKTGTPSIIRLARKICVLVGVYGASDLATKGTPEMRNAVLALVAACQAFDAIDDYPAQIDHTTPIRAGEDLPA